ncbi:MAG: NnrS family protein [Verrucomicrobiae bacterium]|nr:NnrS family protein [Verrucomicrobiae bacterium]
MPRCRFATSRRSTVTWRKEPFRLFFPAGIVASLAGVSLWLLLYAGWLEFYPGEAHARLMVQGFVGAFAMGFLGTAFPKMIESPSLTWPELGILLTSHAGGMVTLAFGNVAAGDGLFLFTWMFMTGCLSVRLAFFRKDLPPPGFVLAGMGLAAGITGTILLLTGRILVLSDFQRTLAHLLLYEAFILGPIAGIGGFLFPRFFADASSIEQTSTWNHRALFAFLTGIALLATYLAQASGWDTSAPVLRAVVATVYLHRQFSPFRRGGSTGSLSFMLRVAIACLLLGILVSGTNPAYRVGVKHLMFISGYGLLILAVATRVTWGHSGNIALAAGKRRSLQIITGIVLLGMTTRVVADMVPAIRVSHHIYAALSWIIAVAIWSWAVLRYVRISDPQE